MKVSFPLAPSLLAAALLLSACTIELDPADLASSPCPSDSPLPSGVVFMPESEIENFCGQSVLDAWAAWLIEHSDERIVLEGHTEEPPHNEHSRRVSRQLADMLRDRLIERGIEPERILVTGYGDDLPLRPFYALDMPSPYNRVYVTLISPKLDSSLQF